MRSSKSRSRSKANRPRSLGNIVNRVFDSSGPEGKVRGTPQQIIDKYLVLARDAQLGNDRVAAENFLQHAEHYTRMLGEAMRESQRDAEGRRENGSGGAEARGDDARGGDARGGEARGGEARGGEPRGGDARGGEARGGQHRGRGEEPARGSDAAAVIDFEDGGPALVETPEARSGRRETSPAAAPAPNQNAAEPAAEATGAVNESGDTDQPAPRRRAPRRSRGAAKPATEGEETRSSAAE